MGGIVGCIRIQLMQQHIKLYYTEKTSHRIFQHHLLQFHCWSTELQHEWRMLFSAYLLKIVNALSCRLLLALSRLSWDPPKKLPDEPPSSQETGGGGDRNRDREKALIISP